MLGLAAPAYPLTFLCLFMGHTCLKKSVLLVLENALDGI